MPDTFYSGEKKDLEALSKDIKFPLILKLAYSEAFLFDTGLRPLDVTPEEN